MKNRHTKAVLRFISILILLFTFKINSQTVDSLIFSSGTGHEKAPVFFLDFYQRYLSQLRYSRCPMFPSCSEYARSVIGHYCTLQAYPLICDRLIRCGHDFNTYDDTIIGQQRRLLDFPYPFTDFFIYENRVSDVQISNAGSVNEAEADFLYRNGFYEQAYMEYLRCLSHGLDSTMVLKAAFAAYHAYDYRRFTREIVSLVGLVPKRQKNLSGELYLLTAKRCYSANLYPTAYAVLEKYRPFFKTPVLYEEYRLLSTVTALFCNIDTVSKLTIKDFSTGSSLINYLGRIDSLSASLDRLQPRSAPAAGLLSAIVPGAGYLVGGRKRTALFALLFNGLIAWSTVEFVRQENYGAATFATLLGSGFYIGSIMGSVRAVDHYNQQKRHSIIKKSLHDLNVDP
ncbi:MAG TPA: membrane protein insertion efficiency factor YidD [Chitinispirillaceae bacterium]|nr:membrane protein insertion efficiency factor YidD [Chitinispirillaceae bacterium]